jgi:tyrosyl-tRNA synthetase
MSLPDELMEPYYTLLTDTPWADVKDLHPRECKARLGRTIVAWLHDEAAAGAAQAAFEQVYARKELPDELPSLALPPERLKDGTIWIVELLELAGMVDSRSQARRLIEQGGVQLDGEKVADPSLQLAPHDGLVLKVGKHKFARIALETREDA